MARVPQADVTPQKVTDNALAQGPCENYADQVTGRSRLRGFCSFTAGLATAALLGTGCASTTNVQGVHLERKSSARRLSSDEVATRAAASVGVVTTDVGRGMAFVVDERGYLVTNRHVLEDADYVDAVSFPAYDPPLVFRGVSVVYIDPVRDLALLRVQPSEDRPLTALPLATTDAPATPTSYVDVDDRVMLLAREADDADEAVGLFAYVGSVTDTDVRNPAVGPGPFLGLTSSVQRGQSGGPVLDRFGRVVGVVTWTWRDRPGGFAVPIAEVARMLAERPTLDERADHEARVAARANDFLSSMQAHDYERARAITAPSHARKVRAATLDVLMERMAAGLMDGYVEALDTLMAGATLDDRDPFMRLAELVTHLGSEESLEALEVQDTLTSEQVVTFFYEFGQAYLAARVFAEQEREGAIRSGLERIYSLEAARSFALADVIETLARPGVEIERVDVMPGAYHPRAVVTIVVPERMELGVSLPAQTEIQPGDRLVLQMEMEWGDWYVGDVQVAGASVGDDVGVVGRWTGHPGPGVRAIDAAP